MKNTRGTTHDLASSAKKWVINHGNVLLMAQTKISDLEVVMEVGQEDHVSVSSVVMQAICLVSVQHLMKNT